VKTNFMGLLGFSNMNVGVDSQVKWGNTRMRVALVLDNTGSMADDGKMPALITATNTLLNQLKGAAVNAGDVYVSIVPFVKDVNVGKSNYNATWLDWTDWDANNGSCSTGGGGGWGGWGGGFGGGQTKSGCTGTWTPNNHNTWTGCVVDRGNSTGPSSANYDQNVTAPTTTIKATLYAPEQYDYCPKAATMALNYDWTAMTTLVNSMTPNGSTNQGIDLQMGWQSLVGGGPYPAPPLEDPNYKYSKVIILKTDGLNTENRWYTSELNRHPAGDDLRQRQGLGRYPLHRAGQHRRRSDVDSSEELRDRRKQVLPADLGKPDGRRVPADRHEPLQPAHRAVRTSSRSREGPALRPGVQRRGDGAGGFAGVAGATFMYLRT
jgi:hypothetical protein